jgi:hypothetical protein
MAGGKRKFYRNFFLYVSQSPNILFHILCTPKLNYIKTSTDAIGKSL